MSVSLPMLGLWIGAAILLGAVAAVVLMNKRKK